MHVRVFRIGDVPRDIWAAYDAARADAPGLADPFFSGGFIRIMGEARGDTRLLVAFDGDRPAGFWALHLRTGGLARPLGGPFSDWHGPVWAGAESPGRLSEADFLKRAGIAGYSAFALRCVPGGVPGGFDVSGVHMSDLSGGYEAFCAVQRESWPRHSKKIRRLMRNLDRDHGEIEFRDEAVSLQNCEAVIAGKREQLVRTGRHDVFRPDWVRVMFDALRVGGLPDPRLRLFSLFVDGKRIASELDLQSGPVLHGWIAVFDRNFAAYSPGHQLMHHILQLMEREGIRYYDAGQGLDHYKRYYSTFQLPAAAGTIRAQSRTWHVERLAGQAWQAGERLSPAPLRQAAVKARQRMDQICLTETALSGKLYGIASALSPRLSPREVAGAGQDS